VRALVLDFTLEKYSEFCNAMACYKIISVEEYLLNRPLSNYIILRHDVDRMPNNALRMAIFEKKQGLRSTYYFRYTPQTYNKNIIRNIANMGHEIGYHYETLSKSNGDYEKAIKMFQYELAEFRKIQNIKTVSMHGSPLSRYLNDKIWEKISFDDYNLLGDGNLSISGIPYFTDTGRNWNNKNNLRDYIEVSPQKNIVENTDDLLNLISTKKLPSLYINTHPERWAKNIPELCLSYSIDVFFNTGKYFIKHIRNQNKV